QRMNKERLLEIEEQFWKGDADFYRKNVADDALFVFSQPVGVLNKDQCIEAIQDGERWADVTFDDVRVVELSAGVAAIVYGANAKTATGSGYSAMATSVYVQRNGWTLLLLHQQSAPAG
ncbi:MAG TPA: nuclear transport factor 2 family protein, partial [Actinomycetota bacterium]|nr:nuclear transport factor 2 family protein [Actinomycetota bacterium]